MQWSVILSIGKGVCVRIRLGSTVSLMVLLLGACGAPVSVGDNSQATLEEAAPGVVPETVRVRANVEYSSDGPPIAVDAGDFEPTENGWADHEIVIRGAQTEWIVAAELAGLAYRASDGDLVATDTRQDAIVMLGFDDTAGFRIVVPDELTPGTHVYELGIPVWLNPVGDLTAQPDDVVSLRVQYDVQAPEVQASLAGFCDVAVPLMNGRTPTVSELDRIIEIAASELEPPDQAAITLRAKALAASLEAEPDASYSYNTRDLNHVIEELCNVNMLWTAAVE